MYLLLSQVLPPALSRIGTHSLVSSNVFIAAVCSTRHLSASSTASWSLAFSFQASSVLFCSFLDGSADPLWSRSQTALRASEHVDVLPITGVNGAGPPTKRSSCLTQLPTLLDVYRTWRRTWSDHQNCEGFSPDHPCACTGANLTQRWDGVGFGCHSMSFRAFIIFPPSPASWLQFHLFFLYRTVCASSPSGFFHSSLPFHAFLSSHTSWSHYVSLCCEAFS